MGSVFQCCLFRTCCDGFQPLHHNSNQQLPYSSVITSGGNTTTIVSNSTYSNAATALSSSAPTVAFMLRDGISAAASVASRVFQQNETNNIHNNNTNMVMNDETATFLATTDGSSSTASGDIVFRRPVSNNQRNSNNDSIHSSVHSGLARTETDVSASNSHDEDQDDTGADCCQRNLARSNSINRLHNNNRVSRTITPNHHRRSTLPPPPEGPRQQIQSVHDFFRRLRDRWQHSSYDSFAALPPPLPPPPTAPSSYSSTSSSVTGRVRGMNSNIRHLHSDRDRRSRSYSHDNETSYHSNADSLLLSSSAQKITKVMNSPLREAVSYNTNSANTDDDIPTISPAEIVLPGSLLQQEMAKKMLEVLPSNCEDECVICMEGFDNTNPRMPTLCGCGENKTYFHLPCLYQWIETSNYCPTCRESLTWEEF